VAEPRATFQAFTELRDEQWSPGKTGFLSPLATRAAWNAGQAEGIAAPDNTVLRYPHPRWERVSVARGL